MIKIKISYEHEKEYKKIMDWLETVETHRVKIVEKEPGKYGRIYVDMI